MSETLERALRGLDAATPELDEGQRIRRAATLERILASGPAAPEPARRPRRLLAGAALAGLATAAVVAVPVVTGGDEAFASWSPVPVALTGTERTEAVEACRTLQGSESGELAVVPGATPTVLVAEARGGWSYVVLTLAGRAGGDLQATCLLPDDVVADPRPGEGGSFGSLGPADEATGPAPARDAVREDEYGVGTIGDDAFVYAEGRAGADVTRVEVTTPGGQRVQASLVGGRWAAWWPAGDAAPDNPEITGAPSYAVTLR